jgi:hypothetical protein
MKPGVLAVAALLVGGLTVERALSQAATESVMTHGLASGAGSSLGKTLGNALGNAAGQLGNRLGQQTSSAPARQRVSTAKATSSVKATAGPKSLTAPSSSGSLIASIQGGVSPTTNCTHGPEPTPATPANVDVSGSLPKENPPAPSLSCALPEDSNSHPAVINLPPANRSGN